MNKDVLRKSSSYQKITFDLASFSMVTFLGLVFILGGIYSNRGLILGGFLIILFGGVYTYRFYQMIHLINLHAKTFKQAEGKVVNMEGYRSFQGVQMIVEFKDDLNEPRRMPTPSTMRIFDISAYLEKAHTIYYSPKVPFVLIQLEDEVIETIEDVEEDPFKL